MSKKINIQIKSQEKLEFTLNEDAKAGDYISLNDLNEVSLEPLKKALEENKHNVLMSLWERNKDAFISQSSEFQQAKKQLEEKELTLREMQTKIQSVEASSLDKVKNAELIKEQEYSKVISDLNNELDKLRESTSDKIKIAEQEKEKQLSSEINSLRNEIDTLKNNSANELEISILKKEKELNDSHQEILKEKDEIIAQLERTKSGQNIKEIGEDLEQHLINEASSYLSLPGVKHSKANDTIDGTKPDFIFEVFDEDIRLTSATIEAKSEGLNSKTKTKNRDHLEKLDSDRKKNNNEYAILVTELEKEDPFIFKAVGEYKNMYMVRPQYYSSFLLLIYNLAMKTKEFAKTDINLKTKQEALDDFAKFKNDILEGVINKIQDKNESVNKETDKIIKSAQKIADEIKITERHLNTIINKLADASIRKAMAKLED